MSKSEIMYKALMDIATIQESSNSFDPEDIGKALDNAVATAQGALREAKEDERKFSILIAYPHSSGSIATCFDNDACGASVEEAIQDAMESMDEDNRYVGLPEWDRSTLKVLLVVAGHHENLKPLTD